MEDNSFSSLAESVSEGISDALSGIAVQIPDIIAALLVFLIGVVVAVVLKSATVRVLKTLRFKELGKKTKLDTVFGDKYNIAEWVGDLVKWVFVIIFLMQALAIVGLEQVNEVVEAVLGYVPQVVLAAVLLLVGSVVADLTSRVVRDAARAAGSNAASLMANVSKYAIWTVVVFTVLAQLGVNTVFLERLFTAVVAMLALAGGLAFGLGGKGLASDLLERLRDNLRLR